MKVCVLTHISTTSGLAYVPIIRCVNYCATKAALHQFILVIREQLKDTGSKIKVIEIVPPAVQSMTSSLVLKTVM